MYEAIRKFASQFAFQPKIQNPSRKTFKKFVVAGMGGSHLAGDLVRLVHPELDCIIHSDYGLPKIAASDLKERLLIVSSYSGNTEETIDALLEARKRKITVGAISVGGKLRQFATKFKIPYIELPDTGIQPRMATGFSFLALLKMMGKEKELQEVQKLATTLHPENLVVHGKALAQKLAGHIPIIYASRENLAIAYNWKIKFNETGKIPAFYNVLPELNHNEMTSFDAIHSTKSLSHNFHFIFLKDEHDDSRVQRRIQVLRQLLLKRGFSIDEVKLAGRNIYEKVFVSLLLADWTAYFTSEFYGTESEQVPMVEEFKKLII